MLCPGHHIDHPSAGTQHPQELLLCKGRKAVQQQVRPAGAHRLAEAGCHGVLCRGQCLGGKAHRRLGNVKACQLQFPSGGVKLPGDAPVVPALAAACIQQMQPAVRGGRDPVFQTQFSHRLPKDAVVPPVQKGAACRHHFLAVAGGFGAHALHRQKMPVALFGTVKAVPFGALQGAFPSEGSPAQGALPRDRSIFSHTSLVWSSMGAVAPPWASIYSSKLVNFC